MKTKLVRSSEGFNNEEEILIGSSQQPVLFSKISAYLAIVLILHTALTLYLFQESLPSIPRLVRTLWALATNSQQSHQDTPGSNLELKRLRNTKQSLLES